MILITNRTTKALIRVSVAGGEAKPLRSAGEGETAQLWPEFLPDGKHYLYLSLGKAPNQQGIYAASLDSNDRTFLVATNTNAAWLQSGQLLFTRGNVLMAQPFDIESLKLSGEPHPVADHIESGATRSTLLIATLRSLSQRRGACGATTTDLPRPPCGGSIAAARTRSCRRGRRLLQPRSLTGQ